MSEDLKNKMAAILKTGILNTEEAYAVIAAILTAARCADEKSLEQFGTRVDEQWKKWA